MTLTGASYQRQPIFYHIVTRVRGIFPNWVKSIVLNTVTVKHFKFSNISGKEPIPDYEKILTKYGIEPTPMRITLLLIIHKYFTAEFTLNNIFQLIDKEKLNISTSGVVATMGLFKIRGLVDELEVAGDYARAPGRPQMKLICTLNKKNRDKT